MSLVIMEAKGGSEKQACDFCFVLNRPADRNRKVALKGLKGSLHKAPSGTF